MGEFVAPISYPFFYGAGIFGGFNMQVGDGGVVYLRYYLWLYGYCYGVWLYHCYLLILWFKIKHL